MRGCDLGQRSDAVGLSERKDEFIKRKKTIKRRVTILCNSCHRDRPDTKLVPGASINGSAGGLNAYVAGQINNKSVRWNT